MTEQTEREKVMVVIKKLLNMAEHAGANEHEALLAAKRAEALMSKYNIDYADAIATEIKTGAGMDTRDVIATAKDNGTRTLKTPPWAQQLAVQVGYLYDTPCRLGQIKTAKGMEQCIRFHGYTHDVEVAAWTFDLLVKTVNRVCKEYRKHPNYLRFGRTVMNAYRMGVVQSVMITIAGMVAEKTRTETTTGTALVHVKRDAIAKKFGEFTYREAKPAAIKDRAAYHHGREDGRKIEVQGAITEGDEVKQLATSGS